MGLFRWIGNKFSRKASQSISIKSGYGNATWTPKDDYEKFANETYLKNVTAYRCIDERSKAFASVPWGLFRKKKSGKAERIEEHDLNELIKRPNPEESFEFLMLKLQAFLIMAGNNYLQRIAPLTGKNKGIPQELWILRPDRVKILQEDGFLQGFNYKVGTREQTWYVDLITRQADVLQFKTFHPTDDWFGAAVTQPTAREIDTDNEQTEWNKKLLENEGRPGMIVTVVGNLGTLEFERMEEQLNSKYGGASNRGKSLILEGESGTKAEPYGFSPTDLDFIEGGRELARKICRGYNVPPQLVGILGDSKYKNYEEALYHFYDGVVTWDLNYAKGELNNWLFERDSEIYFDYIIDNVTALAPRRQKMWDRAKEANHLSINEKRRMTGQDDWGPAGDVILIPSTSIPLEMVNSIEDDTKKVEKKETEEINKLKDMGYTEQEAYDILAISNKDKKEK